MKDSEISSADDLDAALLSQSLEKHRRLWRAAEGRFSWVAITGLLCSGALLAAGIFAGPEASQERLFNLGLGAFMFLQFQVFWAQSKGEAITVLLKRLEQRVTRLEKKAHSE